MEWQEHQWIDEERKLLTDFGLVPISRTDARNILWTYADAKDPNARYMAKRIEQGSYEDKALRRLYSISSSRNPVIPGRLLESRKSCILLMPLLISALAITHRTFPWPIVLKHMYNVVDGLQFLHERNMAFIDVTVPNWVINDKQSVDIRGFTIPPNSIYFIDFEATRILPSGPGTGVKIYDYEQKPAAAPHPPEGKGAVDPYAFDVFKVGCALQWFLELYEDRSASATPAHIPRCLIHFTKALQHQDPEKRPSIFRVRRQFSTLRVWMSCTSWMYRVFGEKFGFNAPFHPLRTCSQPFQGRFRPLGMENNISIGAMMQE